MKKHRSTPIIMAHPHAGVLPAAAPFATSISLKIKSIIGGKVLGEEIFDFLLVRLKPFSSIL